MTALAAWAAPDPGSLAVFQFPIRVIFESEPHWAEVVLNTIQALAVFGGVFVLLRWYRERQDRSTTVLFELDDRFSAEAIVRFRGLLDGDAEYEQVGRSLFFDVCCSVASDHAERAAYVDELLPLEERPTLVHHGADAFMRFYVLLRGVLLARQINEKTLRAVFRYYLCHVANPRRWQLRCYLHRYYPTLREWLAESAASSNPFFRPLEFGWRPLRSLDEAGALREIRERAAGKVLIVTGAGISKASNLPTFREPDSIHASARYWEKASGRGLERDPDGVRRWYHYRRVAAGAALPNAGHLALRSLWEKRNGDRREEGLLLATQNVDDLHERSGFPPERIVHVHGTLTQDLCKACPDHRTGGAEPRLADARAPIRGGLVEYARKARAVPDSGLDEHLRRHHRHTCGRLTRPDVVFFEEDERHAEEILRFVDGGLDREGCDLVLVVGTMATFDYVGAWVSRAAGRDGLVIEVNPHETAISGLADYAFRERAETALPRIVAAL
jgi:NAD-dependent deacetylase